MRREVWARALWKGSSRGTPLCPSVYAACLPAKSIGREDMGPAVGRKSLSSLMRGEGQAKVPGWSHVGSLTETVALPSADPPPGQPAAPRIILPPTRLRHPSNSPSASASASASPLRNTSTYWAAAPTSARTCMAVTIWPQRCLRRLSTRARPACSASYLWRTCRFGNALLGQNSTHAHALLRRDTCMHASVDYTSWQLHRLFLVRETGNFSPKPLTLLVRGYSCPMSCG